METYKFKVLWSERNDMFVMFDMSPLRDDVIWGFSMMPQLFGEETTIELLSNYLGKNANFPEGTTIRTIKIT
jgi:hypothetical protein